MKSNMLKTNMLARAAFAALFATLIAAPLPALAQTPKPAAGSSTAEKPKAKRTPTAGQTAMHERQKKCAAEWKGAKAANKVEKGETWPKYWSACNKRLKAG